MPSLTNMLPTRIINGSSFVCQFDHELTDDDLISLLKMCNCDLNKLNNNIIDQISQYTIHLTLKNCNRYQYYYTDIEYIKRRLHNKSKYLYLLITGVDGLNLTYDNWSLEYELQQLFATKYDINNKSPHIVVDYIAWN